MREKVPEGGLELKRICLLLICIVVFTCCIPQWGKIGVLSSKPQTDAKAYFMGLARKNSHKRVKLSSVTKHLSYGLEFEGMSPHIWKFYGLSSSEFFERIYIMPEQQQEITLRWLFYTLINEKKLIRNVSAGPKEYTIEVPSQNALTATLSQLKDMFYRFLDKASPSPFSHFDFDTRTKLMNNYALKQAYLDKRGRIEQELESLEIEKVQKSKEVASRLGKRDSSMPLPFFEFDRLIDLDGLSREDTRQLKEIKNEINRQWEIVSKPVNSYGSFEEQLAWFEREFGSVEDQHKRFVFGVEPMEDFSAQRVRTPENFAIRVQAHFLGEMLQVYLALIAAEKGADLSAGLYTNFSPAFLSVSKNGKGNYTRASMQTIDDEFYAQSVSFEIRHGLGTPDERAVVAVVIMDFLQRRGFNSNWRGKRAFDLMGATVLTSKEIQKRARCRSESRFPDSIPFPGSDFVGDPLRMRQKVLNSDLSCQLFVSVLQPLLTDWSALVPLDARFAQLRTDEVTDGRFFVESEISQMEENRSQFAKLIPNDENARLELDLQYRAILVAAAQRFALKYNASDVFLEILKSALEPVGGRDGDGR